MMTSLWRLLTSLKTCAWTTVAFCVAGALGTLAMQSRPDLFGDMDAVVFIDWFLAKGFADPVASWWLYALLGTTALLGLNAACCTFDRLVKLFRGTVTLRRLLPHIIHIAFIGVVASHCVSAVSGDRVPGIAVVERYFAPVGETGLVLGLEKFDVVMAPQGYPKDMSASVIVYRANAQVARGVVRINHPLPVDGYRIYLKSPGVAPTGQPYVVFDVNKDDGALPVLISALIFTIANVLYLFVARKEEKS